MYSLLSRNGANHVAFHDLHVVDVVEQLEPRRADFLHELDAPGRVIAHVVVVIHLAVEKLHADGDLFLLREADNPLQPAAQFSSPSSSDIPRRLPEKQMTLGKPLAAANSICSRSAVSSWA